MSHILLESKYQIQDESGKYWIEAIVNKKGEITLIPSHFNRFDSKELFTFKNSKPETILAIAELMKEAAELVKE